MKIFNVIILNTCSRNKRRKNCEELRWRSQSALVRPLAMPCLIDVKISLVPNHRLIVPSTLLALATNIRGYKTTKIHTLKPLKKAFLLSHSVAFVPYVKAYQFKLLNSILFTNSFVQDRVQDR